MVPAVLKNPQNYKMLNRSLALKVIVQINLDC